jgi:hypothetical protein
LDKIVATRYSEIVVSFEPSEEGICWNESMRQNQIVKVKAGDKMCSVGMIRRGRNWNDYGGIYCAECPYFLHKKCIGEDEKKYLSKLEEELGRKIHL